MERICERRLSSMMKELRLRLGEKRRREGGREGDLYM